ncbi:hypothetical protein [Nocardia callitridis]
MNAQAQFEQSVVAPTDLSAELTRGASAVLTPPGTHPIAFT